MNADTEERPVVVDIPKPKEPIGLLIVFGIGAIGCVVAMAMGLSAIAWVCGVVGVVAAFAAVCILDKQSTAIINAGLRQAAAQGKELRRRGQEKRRKKGR